MDCGVTGIIRAAPILLSDEQYPTIGARDPYGFSRRYHLRASGRREAARMGSSPDRLFEVTYRVPWFGMSNAWMSSPFGPGGFIRTFLIAGWLTLIVGTSLVLRYRRTVRRYMLQQTGRLTSAEPSIEQILASARSADRSSLWFSDQV